MSGMFSHLSSPKKRPEPAVPLSIGYDSCCTNGKDYPATNLTRLVVACQDKINIKDHPLYVWDNPQLDAIPVKPKVFAFLRREDTSPSRKVLDSTQDASEKMLLQEESLFPMVQRVDEEYRAVLQVYEQYLKDGVQEDQRTIANFKNHSGSMDDVSGHVECVLASQCRYASLVSIGTSEAQRLERMKTSLQDRCTALTQQSQKENSVADICDIFLELRQLSAVYCAEFADSPLASGVMDTFPGRLQDRCTNRETFLRVQILRGQEEFLDAIRELRLLAEIYRRAILPPVALSQPSVTKPRRMDCLPFDVVKVPPAAGVQGIIDAALEARWKQLIAALKQGDLMVEELLCPELDTVRRSATVAIEEALRDYCAVALTTEKGAPRALRYAFEAYLRLFPNTGAEAQKMIKLVLSNRCKTILRNLPTETPRSIYRNLELMEMAHRDFGAGVDLDAVITRAVSDRCEILKENLAGAAFFEAIRELEKLSIVFDPACPRQIMQDALEAHCVALSGEVGPEMGQDETVFTRLQATFAEYTRLFLCPTDTVVQEIRKAFERRCVALSGEVGPEMEQDETVFTRLQATFAEYTKLFPRPTDTVVWDIRKAFERRCTALAVPSSFLLHRERCLAVGRTRAAYEQMFPGQKLTMTFRKELKIVQELVP